MATTATSTEWARVINTTIRDHIRGEEDATFRRRILPAKLKKAGRVKFNCSGDGFDWRVRFAKADMAVNDGSQMLTFTPTNKWKTAFLDYQGYAIVDAMTKREQLKNRGAAAIIKLFDKIIPGLMDDMQDTFAEEFYVDSSATGNSGRWSGIETMMGATQTVNISSGAARTANAADVVGYPDDTYAGLDTDLAAYGGTWKTQAGIASTWPAGSGDPEYDFWSPTIVNYTSTAFPGATDTWADQCVEAVRFGIRKMKRNKSGAVPLILLEDHLYYDYLNQVDSKERINVEAKGLVELGFEDSIKQDGAEITSEFGIPAAVGYGFDIESMEMRSMQDTLYHADPIEFDMASRTHRFCVDLLGQFKFKSPRNFLKFLTLA